MSKQVPKCMTAFNCRECEKRSDCKEWNKILEEERIRSEELLAQMPELIDLFGLCTFRTGNKEDWKKELAKLSFGC